MKITLGDALFADGPVPVEVSELEAVLELTPLTSDVIAELHKRGVRFDGATNAKQSLFATRSILAAVLHGWDQLKTRDGHPIPYSEENRDKLAALPSFVSVVIRYASDLAVMVEGDEEN